MTRITVPRFKGAVSCFFPRFLARLKLSTKETEKKATTAKSVDQTDRQIREKLPLNKETQVCVCEMPIFSKKMSLLITTKMKILMMTAFQMIASMLMFQIHHKITIVLFSVIRLDKVFVLFVFL